MQLPPSNTGWREEATPSFQCWLEGGSDSLQLGGWLQGATPSNQPAGWMEGATPSLQPGGWLEGVAPSLQPALVGGSDSL